MTDRERSRRRLIGPANYSWLLAVAALIVVLGYIVLNGARTQEPGARGLPAGAKLAPFAVPLAQSSIACDEPEAACDANVATKPRQGDAGSRPACEVRGPTILNICTLARRGPLVLGFLATRGGDCADSFDALDDVRRRHPGVGVALIGIRGELEALRTIVRRHRWKFPVGWDRDGILANLYGVAVCPHITYVRWPGRVDSTSLGTIDGRELDRRVRDAVGASRHAGWQGPR